MEEEEKIRDFLRSFPLSEGQVSDKVAFLSQYPQHAELIGEILSGLCKQGDQSTLFSVHLLLDELIEATIAFTNSFLLGLSPTLIALANVVAETNDRSLILGVRGIHARWAAKAFYSQAFMERLFAILDRNLQRKDESSASEESSEIGRKLMLEKIKSVPLVHEVAVLKLHSDWLHKHLLAKLSEIDSLMNGFKEDKTGNSIKLTRLKEDLVEIKARYFDFVAVSASKVDEIL